jgi:hypothetical protein
VLIFKHFLAQKIDYWNGTLSIFPWFGSEWLTAVSKVKSALKERKFQDTDIQKECDDDTERYSSTRSSRNVSNSSSIVGLSS